MEEYYKENATIIRKYSVEEAIGMMTEQQAIAKIQERGFDQFEIIQNESFCTLKVVDRIDAETLEAYAKELE